MPSVTQRIEEFEQPRGGIIKLSEFIKTTYDDGNEIEDPSYSNPYFKRFYLRFRLHPIITGLAVDYLTRAHFVNDIHEAFSISLIGAKFAKKIGKRRKSEEIAERLINGIVGLDDKSISNACKLATYDVWFRNTDCAPFAKDQRETHPNVNECNDIRIMVNRSVEFFKKNGGVLLCGFGFFPEEENLQAYLDMQENEVGTYGGYTPTVSHGDADYLTSDTIWDLKVSKSAPNKDATLQILMYWIMGQHSGRSIFKNVSKIGIFNPKLYTSYVLDISKIPNDIIKTVERDVICYPK